MAARSSHRGASVFIGLVLMFFALIVLGWPQVWPALHESRAWAGASSSPLAVIDWAAVRAVFAPFLGWQGIYLLLGVGMGLLAGTRAERSLYLGLFLLFLVICVFCNLNVFYGWIAFWAGAWSRVAGLFCLLLGFFLVLCARYYTVRITVRNRAV